eukprot:scaffold276317_cov24-Tisochrysis_lutea.AAC.1
MAWSVDGKVAATHQAGLDSSGWKNMDSPWLANTRSDAWMELYQPPTNLALAALNGTWMKCR